MRIVNTIDSLRDVISSWRKTNAVLTLVPTMGNLHDGHLKLIEVARKNSDRVIVSIFVNPMQFEAGEDLNSYPRSLSRDSKKLDESGADLLFTPVNSEVYPNDYGTFVEVTKPSNILCGEFRPTHFRGVTSVVCKLFNMVQPDKAVFGEKDFQQLVLVRKMVTDLNFPIDIVSVPIVREEDGLALSSRNVYLTPEERKKAAYLFKSISEAGIMLQSGRRDFRVIENQQLYKLKRLGFKPDYFSVRRTYNLDHANDGDDDIVILAAAWLGKARLIDNVQLSLS